MTKDCLLRYGSNKTTTRRLTKNRKININKEEEEGKKKKKDKEEREKKYTLQYYLFVFFKLLST